MDFTHPFLSNNFFIIAGPCVIESEEHANYLASYIKSIAEKYKIPYIFKASFDKANRTSLTSFRGLGITKGLNILSNIRNNINIPILTDVHETTQCPLVAEVADVLQIPAFLCRQTDLLIAAAKTKRTINIKKGQFLAPWDLKHTISKIDSIKNHGQIWLTERGSSFGHTDIIVDFRSFAYLRKTKCPIIFDATHSVQKPGTLNSVTGGDKTMIPILARAAATIVDGFFFEVHDCPSKALSDSHNALNLEELDNLLSQLIVIWNTARNFNY